MAYSQFPWLHPKVIKSGEGDIPDWRVVSITRRGHKRAYLCVEQHVQVHPPTLALATQHNCATHVRAHPLFPAGRLGASLARMRTHIIYLQFGSDTSAGRNVHEAVAGTETRRHFRRRSLVVMRRYAKNNTVNPRRDSAQVRRRISIALSRPKLC